MGPLAVGSGFWVLQGQRFATLRQESIRHSKKPFGASYHPDEGWGLEDFGAFYGRCAGRWLLDDGMREDVEEFKSIAAVCAVAVGAPNIDNAWVEWLDCLRRVGLARESAEVQLNSRRTERRPDPEFEVVAAGLLFHLEEIRPDPDAAIIRTQLLDIDDVCGASERVCRRLADEALKGELSEASNATRPQVPPGTSGTSPSADNVGERSVVDSSKTMTLKEAASALRVFEDTLHRMRAQGRSRCSKSETVGASGPRK